MSHHEEHDVGDGRNRRISFLVFIAFAVIGAYYLVMEHRAHFYGVLPLLLLAACPLLHFLHRRGHGSSRGDSADGAHRH